MKVKIEFAATSVFNTMKIDKEYLNQVNEKQQWLPYPLATNSDQWLQALGFIESKDNTEYVQNAWRKVAARAQELYIAAEKIERKNAAEKFRIEKNKSMVEQAKQKLESKVEETYKLLNKADRQKAIGGAIKTAQDRLDQLKSAGANVEPLEKAILKSQIIDWNFWNESWENKDVTFLQSQLIQKAWNEDRLNHVIDTAKSKPVGLVNAVHSRRQELKFDRLEGTEPEDSNWTVCEHQAQYTTEAACEMACSKNPQCKFYAFNKERQYFWKAPKGCYLSTQQWSARREDRSRSERWTVGVKNCFGRTFFKR